MSRRLRLFALLVTVLISTASVASAAPAFITNPDEQCLIRVVPPDPTWFLRFGTDVALSQDTMVVGTQAQYTEAHAIYVFCRSAEGWTLQQRIPIPFWSDAVAIQGDRLAVAVSGKIQIWNRADGVWTRETTISLPSQTYVSKLALDGDTLVVGAPFVDDVVSPGAVFVYARSGGTWALQQKVTSGTGSTSEGFGWEVALDGSVLAVGAPVLNSSERQTGAVYVFSRSGTSWPKTARLTVSDAEEGLRLGDAIAVEGGRIVVGAIGYGAGLGSVYTWVRSGTGWAYSHRVAAPDGSTGDGIDGAGDYFGRSLLVAGDTLVVGSPGDDDRGFNSGSVYVLRWVGGRWEHQRKIVPPVVAEEAEFGQHLATDAGRVAVGMVGESAGANRSGAVYAFDLGYVTPADTPLTVSAPGILVNDDVPDKSAVTAYASLAPGHGSLAMAADSGFTYAPVRGWTGADKFTYACTDGASVSNDATVTVQTWSPTRAALSVDHSTPAYDGATTLRATLKTLKGTAVRGQRVVFEARRTNGSWYSVGSAVTGDTGVAALRLSGVRSAIRLRARSSWTDTYGAAGSSWLTVTPHVYLSKPSAPATVKRSRSFSVSGYLKPRFSAGSKPVKLKFYRRQSGKWVHKKSVWVKVKNYSTYSKYAGSVTLTSRGSWRVRAYRPASATRAATYSGYRYFKVK